MVLKLILKKSNSFVSVRRGQLCTRKIYLVDWMHRLLLASGQCFDWINAIWINNAKYGKKYGTCWIIIVHGHVIPCRIRNYIQVYAPVSSEPILTLICPQIEVLQRFNEFFGMQLTLWWTSFCTRCIKWRLQLRHFCANWTKQCWKINLTHEFLKATRQFSVQLIIFFLQFLFLSAHPAESNRKA